MRRVMRIALLAITAALSITTSPAFATYVGVDYPCDSSPVGFDKAHMNGREADLLYPYDPEHTNGLVRVGRIAVWFDDFDPSLPVPNPEDLLVNENGFLVPNCDRDITYAYMVLCDGTVVELKHWDDVYPAGHLGDVPSWAFPFTISQSVVNSNGDVHTQILSLSGLLAATIDYSATSGSATFTPYPPPLQ